MFTAQVRTATRRGSSDFVLFTRRTAFGLFHRFQKCVEANRFGDRDPGYWKASNSPRRHPVAVKTTKFRYWATFGSCVPGLILRKLRLSILIPVYNERTMVERSLAQVLNAPLPENLERELIIVDDCSTDGTSEILDRLAAEEPCIRLFRKTKNEGKGAAVRTAIGEAQGDFCLVQDADLEYDPSEYPTLLRPLLTGHADAVFGSRYLVREQTRILPYWHSMINKTLTLLSNMFCNLNLTDMETCLQSLPNGFAQEHPHPVSDRFDFEPEITMKCAKRKLAHLRSPHR